MAIPEREVRVQIETFKISLRCTLCEGFLRPNPVAPLYHCDVCGNLEELPPGELYPYFETVEVPATQRKTGEPHGTE